MTLSIPDATRRTVKQAYSKRNQETGCTFASPIQAATIANLVKRWLETHIAAFLDDAVIYCDGNDLPVLPVLRCELAKAARKRRGDNLSKGEREGIKGNAFRIMANLILTGATDREAAGKAAVLMKKTPFPMKASSLEKEYSTQYRRGDPSLEDELRTFISENPNPEFDQEWRRIREELLEPEDYERGERR